MVFYLTIGDTLVVSNHTPINLVPIKITCKMCIEVGLAVYLYQNSYMAVFCVENFWTGEGG